MTSPNNTLVGRAGSITDAGGNTWTITADGQVAVNGVADPATANVTHLAYANGLVWQENSANLWWSKASPAAGWQPPYGTAAVPVPVPDAAQHDTVIGAPAPGSPVPSFTDASGNIWAIVAGQVAVNGVADPTTANVVELAYVNGQVWQQNTQGLWWSKSAPADAWDPPYGTPVNPVQGTFYVFNEPGNFAVVNIGELTASPDNGSGLAPQSVAKIVTPGISGSGSAITVSTETAKLVVNGDSSLVRGATLNLIGAYRTPSEVSGPMENNGAMTVSASVVEVGALSGSGSILAAAGSTLDIQSAAAGETIGLAASNLFIGGQAGAPGGMTFLAPITMDSASTVTLNLTKATREVMQAGHVYLYNGATEVADLKIGGVSRLYATETAAGAVVISAVHTNQSIPVVFH